jgi:hypothetical protein
MWCWGTQAHHNATTAADGNDKGSGQTWEKTWVCPTLYCSMEKWHGALDHLGTDQMTELYAAQAMSENLRQRPDVFPALLTTLFEIVLFEECSNQWSLSRPMLSLILVNEQVRSWHVTTTESAPYMCGLMGPDPWTRLIFACSCRKNTESLPLPSSGCLASTCPA